MQHAKCKSRPYVVRSTSMPNWLANRLNNTCTDAPRMLHFAGSQQLSVLMSGGHHKFMCLLPWQHLSSSKTQVTKITSSPQLKPIELHYHPKCTYGCSLQRAFQQSTCTMTDSAVIMARRPTCSSLQQGQQRRQHWSKQVWQVQPHCWLH